MAWHHKDLTTGSGAPPLGEGGAVDAYVTTFSNEQFVVFVTQNGHVHELYVHDGRWRDKNLTSAAGAPSASLYALSGYQTSFNKQKHVVFFTDDRHVHELYHDSAWHHKDLTTLAGAPPASKYSEVLGYQTAFNNMQHVIFFTDDGHIHELYHDGAWHRRDLTNLAAAPNAVVSNDMSGLFDAYVTTFNNQQHIIFSGVELHLHELYNDGAWHHKDLTAITGDPYFLADESALAGYQTSFNNQQHIIFSIGTRAAFSTAAHVHELYHDGAWHHTDLTTLTGAPNADVSTSLDGYVTSFNNQQHVNYLDQNGHIQELYHDNAWHHHDLTALSGAPTAVGGSDLIGYQTAFNDRQHVIFEVYTGTELHICELYHTP